MVLPVSLALAFNMSTVSLSSVALVEVKSRKLNTLIKIMRKLLLKLIVSLLGSSSAKGGAFLAHEWHYLGLCKLSWHVI